MKGTIPCLESLLNLSTCLWKVVSTSLTVAFPLWSAFGSDILFGCFRKMFYSIRADVAGNLVNSKLPTKEFAVYQNRKKFVRVV